ncbi:uncharacterized protein [Palaemon carinicauda]|uniref:uncharacterized protein n=1 Tax=Palaemon carinicauda TaxID=392227 RepID=UPI0035B61298
MKLEDIPKTVIITTFRSYSFYYSCFDLRNAEATFQRLMDGILGDLPLCECYINDVLMFSPPKKNTSLPTHRSRLSATKRPCSPDYKFLPAIATTLAPLYTFLKGKPKELKWGPLQEVVFCNAINTLSSDATLTFFIDTIDVAIGAVHEQVVRGSHQTLAFFCWKIFKAVHLAVHLFYYFLEGTPFVLCTPLMPPVHAFSRESDTRSARQRRHLVHPSTLTSLPRG